MMLDAVIQAIVSGLFGGLITGLVSITAIRIHVGYLRRDVDAAHERCERLERTIFRRASDETA